MGASWSYLVVGFEEGERARARGEFEGRPPAPPDGAAAAGAAASPPAAAAKPQPPPAR
jgi:hypothetical protein